MNRIVYPRAWLLADVRQPLRFNGVRGGEVTLPAGFNCQGEDVEL